MRYVVNRIIKLILDNEPSKENETMIRIDGFDDMAIYEQVASKISMIFEKKGLTVDIKLAKNKWNFFEKNSENTTIIQSMKQHNWIAEEDSITHYRNLHTSDVVILMGTEEEEDKGGLANCKSITPEILVKTLNGKYHLLFDEESFSDRDNELIDRLYRDLFKYQAIDICKLSNIVDLWEGKIANIKDFVELFFKDLPMWGLPFRRLEIPSIKEIMGRRNILAGCHRFIVRQLFNSKMSVKQYKKYIEKIDFYDSGKSELAKYTSDNECWSEQGVESYSEFAKILKEFIIGENIEENTKKLLKVDYCIVEDVLEIGIPTEKKPPKDKVKTLVGEPLEVFSNALFLTLAHIRKEDINVEKIEFNFSQAEIVCMYSEAEDEEEKQQLLEAWKSICIHCGGVIEYLNKIMWTVNDNEVELTYLPQKFLNPSQAYNYIKEGKYVKPASANKSVSKISFSTKYEVNGKEFHHEFQWKFNVNNSWSQNFGELCLQDFCNYKEGNFIPVSEIKKLNSIIFSKSEEEFFDRLRDSDIEFDFNLADYVDKKVPLDEKVISAKFDEVGKTFIKFVYSISNDGFYNCISKDNSELTKLCDAYRGLGEYLRKRSFPENLKWVLDAYINSFTIIRDINVFDSEKEIESCIVPAWHPATLEKLNDQKIFFLDGCNEWWNTVQDNNKISDKEITDVIKNLLQMSMIQSTLDIFPSYGQVYFGAISSFGAFSLYGRNDIKNENRLRDMIHKDAIFDDDFDRREVAHLNDNAKMIYDVVLDYAKAFPNSANNLNLVFINPSELQPIVAAIYKYIDGRRKMDEFAKINISIRILVKPENKGGRNYLAYWMDEFFSQDENINIHTYLNEWNSKSVLEKLLNGNNDIAFVMDLLKVNNLGFVSTNSNISLAPSQCRFPIVYKPTPISNTSVKRAIELSQPQFKVAYEHTQIVRYRNNMEKVPDEMYIASKEVSIDEEGKEIVDFLHEKAYWVVCIDSGMDGALLRGNNTKQNNYNVIGFSTGKGAYGQYNLTITTRKTILDTIRKKLENRLYGLFKWDNNQIKKAAQLCIDEASGLDGISLLSATNPKDENIREFIAYVLTSLREKKKENNSVLKIVVHLDSYKHWFDGNIDRSIEDSAFRPDFLVIEVILTDDDKLKLEATVTECKTSIYANSEKHKEHAMEQVKHGLDRLSKIFNPNSGSIKRRYWFAQLYRALAFAQITFSNNTDEFTEVSSKLRSILDGNYEIEWKAKILGFWLDLQGEKETETVVDENIVVCDIPQKVIQSLLLEDDIEQVKYVNVDSKEILEDENQQEKIMERERILEEEMVLSHKRRNKRNSDEEELKNFATSNEERNKEEKAETENKEYTQEENNENQSISNADNDKVSDEEEPQESSNTRKDNLDDIRVLIGKSKNIYDVYWEFGNSQMANRHLLITGTSGQGKTYSIQTMLYELAKKDISSVIFDYTEGFRLDQLEPEFVDSMNNKIKQHIVKVQGVPINPFKRQEQDFAGMKIQDTSADVAGRFANILTHVYGFGEQQYAAIYEATRIGMEKYGDDMDMNHFQKELLDIQKKNTAAKTVISKMTPFFHSVEFNKDDKFDWGSILYAPEAKMNIFQLTMIDREMQVIITELMLWDAWYYTKNYGSKDKPFVVVLDEAQNLSHKENSPSKAILTEGRKFGWSAWFATQSLKVLADDEVVRLMQAAYKLYFKPTDEEITKMSKQLDPTNPSLWLGALKALKKGQCIVVGDRMKDDGTFGSAKPTITNITSFKDRC